MKIKTYCPVFKGFYNSIYEFNEDIILEDFKQEQNLDVEFDELDINYAQYHEDIAISFCEVIKEKLSDFVFSIEYEKIISPKFYNYSNDSINCIIEPNIKNIKNFIYDNIEDFKQYLKNNYTSFDGFISYYSNMFNDWKENTNDFQNFNEHELGSILNFIFSIKYDSDEYLNLYYQVKENICELCYLMNEDEILKNHHM